MILVFFQGHGFWTYNKYVELESRDDFGAWGIKRIENMNCPGVFGAFRLTKEDEEIYQYTKSLGMVNKLLPCTHPKSAFSKYLKLKNGEGEPSMIVNTAFDKDELEHYSPEKLLYFQIQRKQKEKNNYIEVSCQLSLLVPEKHQDNIVIVDEISNKEIITNETNIKKRYGKDRPNESLIVIHAALDEIEKNTGKTPTAQETAHYVLSGNFEHVDVLTQPDQKDQIGNRKMKVSSGNILTAAKIKRSYREVIFPK